MKMGFMSSKVKPLVKREENYEIMIIKEHEACVNALAINEAKTVVATASDDCTVRLWSTTGEMEESLACLEGHEKYVNCLAFEDMFLVSGSADKTIRKWNVTNFKCCLAFRGHSSVVNRILVVGNYLYSSSYDQTIIKWNFQSGETIIVYRGHKLGVYSLAYAPHQDSGPPEEDNVFDRSSIQYHDTLISGSSDHTAIVWNADDGQCLHQLIGHQDAITCLVLESSNAHVFTGSMDKTIKKWSISTGQLVATFEGHSNSVICLTIKGKMLYSGSSDKTGKSWIIDLGHNTRTFSGHEHSVTCIAYDDGTVFTGCGDGTIRCFDSKAGTLKRTLRGHSSAINAILLNGEMLFSGSNDGTLRIWDVSGMTDETAFASQHSKKKSKARDIQKTTDEKLFCATSNLTKNKTSNKITVEDDY